jgi:hypothetical protein
MFGDRLGVLVGQQHDRATLAGVLHFDGPGYEVVGPHRVQLFFDFLVRTAARRVDHDDACNPDDHTDRGEGTAQGVEAQSRERLAEKGEGDQSAAGLAPLPRGVWRRSSTSSPSRKRSTRSA